MLKKLTSLANYLDASGLYAFATEVDDIASEYYQKELDPRYEKIFSEVLAAFQAAAKTNESINKTLPEILNVLDSLHKTKTRPAAEFFIPEGQATKMVSPYAYKLAGEIAALNENVEELNRLISAENDPTKKESLSNELITIQGELKENNKKLEEIKDSPDFAIVSEYINTKGKAFTLIPRR